MVRYEDDDSDATHPLLITAGVVAGLLAGAAVAQRLGGWKGVRRLLAHRRAPLLAALRAVMPTGTLTTVLDAIGIDEIFAGLAGQLRGAGKTRTRRRPDPDLDEHEVDDFERAAAGLDDDEEDDDADAVDDAAREQERRKNTSRKGASRKARVAAVDHDAIADRAPGDSVEHATDEDEDEDEDHDADVDEIVEPLTPEAIERAVLDAFRRHPVLRQRALEIAVDEDGVAELTGWVRRERDIRIARRVAATVPGVERVLVDIAVRDGARRRSEGEAHEA